MKFIRDLLSKKNHNDDMIGADDHVESLEQSYRDTIGAMSDDRGEASVADILSDVAARAKPRPVRPTRARDIIAGETPAPEAAPAPEVSEAAPEAAPAAPAPAPQAEAPAAPPPAMNIWDMEDDGSDSALPEPTPAPAPAAQTPAPETKAARSPARSRRTKTRLIGFDKSNGAVVDLFEDADRAPPAPTVRFPVGWIVVAKGPGRGESFPLMAGMSQIGRGEDQAVQLDFGDNAISRTNHAAIVYDTDNKEFLLGHGGKSNIVRLNDKPLISNETLKSGDMIRIGETVLRFVALCGDSFDWGDSASGEDDDVAIA